MIFAISSTGFRTHSPPTTTAKQLVQLPHDRQAGKKAKACASEGPAVRKHFQLILAAQS